MMKEKKQKKISLSINKSKNRVRNPTGITGTQSCKDDHPSHRVKKKVQHPLKLQEVESLSPIESSSEHEEPTAEEKADRRRKMQKLFAEQRKLVVQRLILERLVEITKQSKDYDAEVKREWNLYLERLMESAKQSSYYDAKQNLWRQCAWCWCWSQCNVETAMSMYYVNGVGVLCFDCAFPTDEPPWYPNNRQRYAASLMQ